MRAYTRKLKAEGKTTDLHKKNYYKEVKYRAFDVLGGRFCINCGCDDLRILELNHINGGGRKDIVSRQYQTRQLFYDIIFGRVDKKLYNVLCRVCNALHYIQQVKGIVGHTIRWQNSRMVNALLS